MLPALTSIRFFLAFLVVCVHYNLVISKLSFFHGLFATSANYAVPAFFCLSGFILTYQYSYSGWNATAQQFWIVRFARVMPVYWFCLLLAILFFPFKSVCISPDAYHFFGITISNALLVQSWIDDPNYFAGFNPPGYTLSIELFFYCIFPFMMPKFANRHWVWLGGSLILALCIRYFSTPEQYTFVTAILPLGRLYEFIIGATAACLFLNFQKMRFPSIKLPTVVSMSMLEITAISLCLAWIQPQLLHFAYDFAPKLCVGILIDQAVFLTLFAILLSLLASGQGILSKVLAAPTLVALGELTFAIYIFHDLPIKFMYTKSLLPPHGTTSFIVFMACIVAASFLIYKYIEQPWRKLITKSAGILSLKGVLAAFCRLENRKFVLIQASYLVAIFAIRWLPANGRWQALMNLLSSH